MNTSELEARPYAPCPTCGQYSHSIGEDQIVAAYNHFQAMVCENPAKPYPTGYAFSDETRDAANVLLQSLSTLRQRIEALEAENARLKKALLPEWFYYGDEQTSDRCRLSVHEVIDEDFLWDNRAEGEHVVEIATALSGPTIWAHVKFFTDEEKDVRQSDDDYEITEYPTEEAARQALGEG